MDSWKAADCYGCIAGNETQQAHAEQAYIQAELKGTETWVLGIALTVLPNSRGLLLGSYVRCVEIRTQEPSERRKRPVSTRGGL